MSAQIKNIRDTGLRLIKKGQKGIIHAIFSRFGVIILLLALQAIIFLSVLLWFQSFASKLFFGGIAIGFLVSIYILNTRSNPSAKLTWVVLVMAFPLFGTLLYLFTEFDFGHRALRDRVSKIIEETKDIIPHEHAALEDFEHEDPGAASVAKYLYKTGNFPIFNGTDCSYFSLGEDLFDALLEELEKAKDFIFLEYFIIDEGIMWGKILEILAKKVREGVEVRLIYDGTNEFVSLPRNYPELLKEYGIKCKVFAPISPFISTHYNYRDHRKILVIDGKVAVTGGINFADRYINKEKVHGHWKDTAVMLKGKAVKSFTLMFLQIWSITEKEQEFGRFLSAEPQVLENAKGFVIPYGDCPH